MKSKSAELRVPPPGGGRLGGGEMEENDDKDDWRATPVPESLLIAARELGKNMTGAEYLPR